MDNWGYNPTYRSFKPVGAHLVSGTSFLNPFHWIPWKLLHFVGITTFFRQTKKRFPGISMKKI